jgi:GxxExxY protein
MASAGVATKPSVNRISGLILSAAMKVHSTLGPGLLESACAACLLHELRKRGLRAQDQLKLPVVYDGVTIDLVTEWIW